MTNFGATVRVVRFEPVDQPEPVEPVEPVEPAVRVERVEAPPRHVQPVVG